MGVINAVTDVIVDNDNDADRRMKILIGTSSDAVITDQIDRTPIIAQVLLLLK